MVDSADELLVGAAFAFSGDGLICVPITSSRLVEVPRGVQVMRVTSGLVVGYTNAPTSVGFTTFIRETL